MKIGLCFGAFAPSIKEQLKSYNTGIDMTHFQALADSVTYLELSELMTEKQAYAARKKISEMIFSVVEIMTNEH